MPILLLKFEYCALDFMVELPEIIGFNALLVIADKLGKLLCLLTCRLGKSILMLLKLQRYFLKIGLGYSIFWRLYCMIMMLGSQVAFDKHCKVSWTCKCYLVAFTILKPMGTQSTRAVPLSRWFVLSCMKALIWYSICLWWSWLWTVSLRSWLACHHLMFYQCSWMPITCRNSMHPV